MNVSRETSEKLDRYIALLEKWNPKINLVSTSSLKDAASRHILDSLQILQLQKHVNSNYVDLGSGGGFPGAVIAIALAQSNPSAHVTLIESDQRKCVFLRTVSRETNTPFKVLAERIEDVKPQAADVLTARALAPLTNLLSFTQRHMSPTGTAFFPKGETWEEEVAACQKQWNFQCKVHKSVTSPNAVILEIGDVSRA